jgi:cellobiose transport system permease protein
VTPAADPADAAVTVTPSLLPLHWSVVVASHDNAGISGRVAPRLPSAEFAGNVREVFEVVDFRPALRNSTIVACVVTVSNVLLSTMAESPLPACASWTAKRCSPWR